MAKRTILVDSARRELEKHGTETFPMTVNHDDLWSFEGKNVPIHWHNDLEINLIREGEAVFQVYQKSYRVRTGEGFLLNRNVPHSCSSPGNEHVRYSTILVRPDFLYGDFGSDVERKCFQPFLQNSAIPCIYLTGFDENGKEILQKLNQVEEAFDRKRFCYELKIKGLLCEAFAMILYGHRQELTKFVPANLQELERLEKMLNYLNMHFTEVISLQDLADQVHLSREVCCRLFKKYMRMTIFDYLLSTRIQNSIPLLMDGENITTIAGLVGFSSPAYYGQIFKRYMGMSPSQYKKNAAQSPSGD